MAFQTYDEALHFIHSRPHFKKKPTLKRMKLFLNKLGNPQEGQKYIHITGTNGKGSVVAMTRQVLMEHGLNVGSFTSPYITRFNERIEINGQPISDADLVKYVNRIAPVVAELDEQLPEGGPVEFEIDTAIMFCYFADHDLDVIILEVGIGGRWDSTNVINDPVVAGIVTVGYDHMKYLGNTLGAIAKQKAGIIKPGHPVVVGNLTQDAEQVVEEDAAHKNSQVFKWDRDYSAELTSHQKIYPQINYSGLQIHHEQFQLSLAGDYQVENAAIAITLVQVFCQQTGMQLDLQATQRGLKATSWPGRMEVVNQDPTVILDGAHNLPGMQALVNTIKDDFRQQDVYVLVAILADKQYDLMLGELASLPNVHITVTTFAGPYSGRHSADLADAVQDIPSHFPIHVDSDWQRAMVSISSQMSSNDVLLITGSLYFISDVRHLMLD